MKRKEDLRVKKTKLNLYNGLVKLMEEKPFEDIKIQIMDLPQQEIISLYGINVGDYSYNDMNIIDGRVNNCFFVMNNYWG